MTPFIASQLLVSLAALFDIASFQFKNRTALLTALCISGLLIASHFVLLREWTAACLMAIGACRYFAGIFISDPRMKWVFYAVTLLGSVATFNGVTSILSCTASLMHTKASFCASDKLMRWLMMIGTAVWGIHDVIVGSPVAALIDFLFIASCIIGYYRIYWKKPLALSS